MNAYGIMTESEIETQSSNSEEKKMIPGLCVPAGIKTPNVNQNQLQKRHFPNKMGSDIFFCALPPENHKTSGNNANEDDLSIPAETETETDDDQKQSEETSENAEQDEQVDSAETVESTEIEEGNVDQDQSEEQQSIAPEEDNAGGDEQIDSAGKVEATEEAKPEKSQRRHFHNKTTSDIFFCGLSR